MKYSFRYKHNTYHFLSMVIYVYQIPCLCKVLYMHYLISSLQYVYELNNIIT